MTEHPTPTLDAIEACRARIDPYVIETPVMPWYGAELGDLAAPGTEVLLKLELFQRTGTFKPRGALNVMMGLSEAEKERGVTAVSAGNHAIAVSYAASLLGLAAKVVMHKAANPLRVERVRRFGAELVLADDITAAFAEVNRIRDEEGRVFVHPFEGPGVAEGTATVGLELCRQVDEPLDAVVVPVGGGGLLAGVAAAVKQRWPDCAVYGVEPEGACGMSLSLAQGAPVEKVAVDTIADSLGAPLHAPYSFALVRRHVDDVVTVSEQALSPRGRAACRSASPRVRRWRECRSTPSPTASALRCMRPTASRWSGATWTTW